MRSFALPSTSSFVRWKCGEKSLCEMKLVEAGGLMRQAITDPVLTFQDGIATVPRRYLGTLKNYSRWANCQTPLQSFVSFLSPFWNDDEPLFAAQHPFKCLYVYESLGVAWPCLGDDSLLHLLWRGKNTRDWWARELREWLRLGVGFPIFSVTEFREIVPVRKCFEEISRWQWDAIRAELKKRLKTCDKR